MASRSIEGNFQVWFEAMADLIARKDYAEVTATEIAQAAGLSRVSFYNYFADKEDLLWRTIRYLFLDVQSRAASLDPETMLSDGKPITFYVFEAIDRNRPFFESLFCRGMPHGCHVRLMEYITEQSYEAHVQLRNRYKNKSVPYRRINQFLTGALMEVIRCELAEKQEWDSNALAQWFTSLAIQGLSGQLGPIPPE